MLIGLTQLPTDGLGFEHQYAVAELDLSQHEFRFLQTPLVKGRVKAIELEMQVKGTIAAELEAECDRCLEAVTLPIDKAFDLFYLPEKTQAGQGGEIELLERELDVSFYRDDRIDLDELTLEQLELSLPLRILCREDCHGLCAQCGTNLNLEQCTCQPEIDSRWQALADLKN